MKRITAMLLSLLLGAGLLTVCWRGTEYHREDTERENGVTLYVRRDRQAAFAGNLTWDGQSDTVDYVIPDRVDGAPVTALGGLLYGTAFKKLPCGWGFIFMWPQIQCGLFFKVIKTVCQRRWSSSQRTRTQSMQYILPRIMHFLCFPCVRAMQNRSMRSVF